MGQRNITTSCLESSLLLNVGEKKIQLETTRCMALRPTVRRAMLQVIRLRSEDLGRTLSTEPNQVCIMFIIVVQ